MRKLNYIMATLFSLLLISCHEDVVLDLGKIQKWLVVEATVTNGSPVVMVKLSYSQDFYDIPDRQLLANATVALHCDDGQSEILVLGDDSIFKSQSLLPLFGKNYTLKVDVDDQQVEVATTLPHPVGITSITFVSNPFLNNPDSLNAYVSVADPVNEDNYFRLRIGKIHVEPSGEYYLMDDSFGKNGMIPMPVYYKMFAPGDTVVVELDHLTKALYQYYSTLSENVGGSFNSVAPGNPDSNMPDKVYGYFGGYAIARDTVVVGGSEF